MRVNVYAEELVHNAEVVTKEANGKTLYGIRLFLASSPLLHHNQEDDDRSGVTFWVPWTHTGGTDFPKLGQIFTLLQSKLAEAERGAKK